MAIVVSVRFKDSGKTYYFDPGDLTLQPGDMVIVDTIHGPELAKVAYQQIELAEDYVGGEIKAVLRRAEQKDFHANQDHDYADILARCQEKITEHGLEMSLIKAEYSYGSRLTFYFTAEQRVDFRLLVRDLARTFKTRIELCQVGPRDEAKLLGGIGICGRMLCCSTFLPDYTRVSIKMAKDQDLPLNPAKISGICNRLLCCLSYEHQQYIDLKAGLPRRGTWVETVDGKGHVVDVNVLEQRVTVQFASSGMQEQYPIADIHEIDTPSIQEQREMIEEEKELAATRRADRMQAMVIEARLSRAEERWDKKELLSQLEAEDMGNEGSVGQRQRRSSAAASPASTAVPSTRRKRQSPRPSTPASTARSSSSERLPAHRSTEIDNQRPSKRRRMPPTSSSELTGKQSDSPAALSQQSNRERRPDTRTRPRRKRPDQS